MSISFFLFAPLSLMGEFFNRYQIKISEIKIKTFQNLAAVRVGRLWIAVLRCAVAAHVLNVFDLENVCNATWQADSFLDIWVSRFIIWLYNDTYINMGRFLYATFILNSCRIVTGRWWISIIENHINPKAYKLKAKVVNLLVFGFFSTYSDSGFWRLCQGFPF